MTKINEQELSAAFEKGAKEGAALNNSLASIWKAVAPRFDADKFTARRYEIERRFYHGGKGPLEGLTVTAPDGYHMSLREAGDGTFQLTDHDRKTKDALSPLEATEALGRFYGAHAPRA